MNHKEFNEVVEKQLNSSLEVLSKKAEEYATGEDRFHNFNVAARLRNCTPEEAFWA